MELNLEKQLLALNDSEITKVAEKRNKHTESIKLLQDCLNLVNFTPNTEEKSFTSGEHMAAICLHIAGGTYRPNSDELHFTYPVPLIYYELFGMYVVGGFSPPVGEASAFASPVLTPSAARANAEANERRRHYGVGGWNYGIA